MNDLFKKRNELAQKLASMTPDDVLKTRTGYAGKSQQWQYGFDLACREKQAEIDALKAQNADLLAALTESLAYVEATLSNHDAGCQRHPSTEHARDCILSDLDQIKTAIAKARGDL